MKIYTKTGDDGTTGLFTGQRVTKSDLRVEVYGTVDELNSVIGMAKACDIPKLLGDDFEQIQHQLFVLGADFASPMNPEPKFAVKRISNDKILWLENKIDEYTAKLPPLKVFILPGGTMCASFVHQARTVCRRAERLAVNLAVREELGDYSVKYLNRLSDYLFTAARMANFLTGKPDIEWKD